MAESGNSGRVEFPEEGYAVAWGPLGLTIECLITTPGHCICPGIRSATWPDERGRVRLAARPARTQAVTHPPSYGAGEGGTLKM